MNMFLAFGLRVYVKNNVGVCIKYCVNIVHDGFCDARLMWVDFQPKTC